MPCCCSHCHSSALPVSSRCISRSARYEEACRVQSLQSPSPSSVSPETGAPAGTRWPPVAGSRRPGGVVEFWLQFGGKRRGQNQSIPSVFLCTQPLWGLAKISPALQNCQPSQMEDGTMYDGAVWRVTLNICKPLENI